MHPPLLQTRRLLTVHQRHKTKEGFGSFAELLVLAIIIGLVAVVGGATVLNNIASTQGHDCSYNLRTIQNAKLAWAAQHPASDLPADEASRITTLLQGGYLRQMPVCPETPGNPYVIGSLEQYPSCPNNQGVPGQHNLLIP